MTSLKKTIIATTVALVPFCSFAAQQLTEEQANSMQSFKSITIRGAFYTDSDYVMAMSKAADNEGALLFI